MSETQGNIDIGQSQLDIKISPDIQNLDGFKEFMIFLKKFPIEEKKVMDILSNPKNLSKIKDYDSFFPENEKSLNQFISMFGKNERISTAKDDLKRALDIKISLLKQGDEKQQQGYEKQQQGYEKQQQTIETSEKFKQKSNTLDSFISSLNDLKSTDSKLNSFIKEITGEYNSSSSNLDNLESNIESINQKITNYLKDGDNLKTLLSFAKKGSRENYDKILKYVDSLATSSQDSELIAKFDSWKSQNMILQTKSPIREVQLREFFGNDYLKTTKEGDIVVMGDKVMDLSTNPPSAYIRGRTNFLVETSLPKIPSSYSEKRKEWSDKKQEILTQYTTKKEQFETKKTEIGNLEKEYKEEQNEGNELRLQELEGKIKETKLLLDKLQSEINSLIDQATKLDTEMMRELSKLEFGDREQRQAKEAKIRQTISFIEQIGFDLLPQSATDSIIRQYNVGRGEGLQIDLSDGNFGINPPNKNSSTILAQEKVSFIDFFNQMVNGKNSEIPLFSKEEIYILKNGGNIGLSKDQFRSRLAPIINNTGVVDIARAVNNLK